MFCVIQAEELGKLKEKTHKDLWKEDLETFLSELDVRLGNGGMTLYIYITLCAFIYTFGKKKNSTHSITTTQFCRELSRKRRKKKHLEQ